MSVFKINYSVCVLLWLTLNIETCVSQSQPCVCLQKVVEGLFNPVSVEFKGNSFFVTEQRGVVRHFREDGYENKVFLNISHVIVTSPDHADERGLLGFALHPMYEQNGKVYVYYIKSNDSEYAQVSEFVAVNGEAPLGSQRPLLEVQQVTEYGNAGHMFFGRDGFLYISVGDGIGDLQFPDEKAQNLSSYLGKILRIDVNKRTMADGSQSEYGIPPNNPFVSKSPWKPEVFAYGCRNMWRCSQDTGAKDGKYRIFCADPGMSNFEEVNIIQSGGNYGWPIKEGYECLNKTTTMCESLQNDVSPIYVYNHTKSMPLAIIGGFVYRGEGLPQFTGSYIFGDAMTSHVSVLRDTSSGWKASDLVICGKVECPCGARESLRQHLLSFAQDNKGEVYVLTTSSFTVFQNDGIMLKIVPKNADGVLTCGCQEQARSTFLIVLIVLIMYF